MKPTFRYDKQHDIAYLKFNDHDVEGSIQTSDELLVFDLDKDNQLVGLEVLSVKRLIETAEKSNKGIDRPIDYASMTVSVELIEHYLLFNAYNNPALLALAV